MVRDLMIETGVLEKKIDFSEYTDTRFSDRASIQTAWKYQAGTAVARLFKMGRQQRKRLSEEVRRCSEGIS
jgi:hypothetical protein